MNAPMTIYAPSTEVELKNCKHLHAIVEKVIIGDNQTVQYQLVVYGPAREQLVVNDYEIAGIAKEAKKTIGLGFHAATKTEPNIREIQIFVDDENKLVNFTKRDGVSVRVLNKEEVTAMKEREDGQEPQE